MKNSENFRISKSVMTKGFISLKGIILIIVLMLIGVGGWYFFEKNNFSSRPESLTNNIVKVSDVGDCSKLISETDLTSAFGYKAPIKLEVTNDNKTLCSVGWYVSQGSDKSMLSGGIAAFYFGQSALFDAPKSQCAKMPISPEYADLKIGDGSSCVFLQESTIVDMHFLTFKKGGYIVQISQFPREKIPEAIKLAKSIESKIK
jgi:hypothetical protein